jgi:hypothetical protein
MAAISNRTPATPIAIQYDCRGKRETKQFDDAIKARHFYAQKLNAGKNPAVTAGVLEAVAAEAPAPAAELEPAASLTAAVAKKARAHKSPATIALPTPAPTPVAEPVAEEITRPRIAGRVIAKFGVAVGVNAQMVQLCDEWFGKANPAESRGRLRNALQAIRGFCEAHNLDPLTGRKLAATK